MVTKLEAKKRAIEFYCFSIIESMPFLYWKDKAIESIINEKQDESTERFKRALEIAQDYD